MYLIHLTEFKNLKKILEDKYLKSSKKTKIIGQGSGLYKENDFVFFSVGNQLKDNRLINLVLLEGGVIIYLKSDFLYDKVFYASNLHSPDPEYLGEWKTKKGLSYTRKYKRKYNKNYPHIKKVLNNLYKYSIKAYEPAYIAFSQIAIKNCVKLKNNIAFIQIVGNKDYMTSIRKNLEELGNYEANLDKYYNEHIKTGINILNIMFN